MRKQACCLTLAALLAAVLLMPALAADGDLVSNQVIEVTGSPPPEPSHTQVGAEGGVSTTYTATIAPQLISAQVPCKVDFVLHPNVYSEQAMGEDNPELTWIQNPETAVITNLSSFPIDVMVDGAIQANGSALPDGKQQIVLVDTLAQVDEVGKALLVLGREGEEFESQAAFEARALTGGTVGGSGEELLVMSLGTGEEDKSSGLCVYGRIAEDTANSYVLTGNITLRIKTAVR